MVKLNNNTTWESLERKPAQATLPIGREKKQCLKFTIFWGTQHSNQKPWTSQFRSSFFKVQPAQVWLEALNMHKTSSPSQLQTWLASPLLSVRLVTRTTCILVIAIDNNRYESCQSNSRVIGCSIQSLSKSTKTYILWFSDFEGKSLLLLNFWPPLFFKKRGVRTHTF